MKIISQLILYCYIFLLCCCLKEVDPISQQNGLQKIIKKTLNNRINPSENSDTNVTNNLEDLQKPIPLQEKSIKEELEDNTEIILTD